MTSDHHDEYGEILRRALHAEAEKVVPSPDGLERIRAGIEQRSQRRFGLAWFTDRFATTWGRPLLAAGAALIIVAVGVSAPQTIDRITAAAGGGDNPSGDGGNPAVTDTMPGVPGQPLGPGSTDRPGQRPNTVPSGSVTPTPTAPGGGPGCVGGEPQDPSTAATSTPAPASTCSTPPGGGGGNPGDPGGPGDPTEPGDPGTSTPPGDVTQPPDNSTSEPPDDNSSPPANPEPGPS